MKYNYHTKNYLISKDSLNEYIELQEAKFKDDLENHHLYSVDFLFSLVRGYKFQTILDKYSSVGHRTLLFSFYDFKQHSIFEAAVISHESHLSNIKKAVLKYGSIFINNNGGFSPMTEKQSIENYQDFDFALECITDNNSTDLIIENSKYIDWDEFSLLEQPSSIVFYKNIYKNRDVDSFLRSNDNWSIWIQTQGLDINLYEIFLTNYKKHIKEIFVKTKNSSLINEFKNKFGDIEFLEF